MIQLKNVTKVYKTAKSHVTALDNVSLHIEKGDIFGIIGFSGAGKSTLIRCINRLEQPDRGEILVGNQNITTLSPLELREARKKIGMIFQHFCLMDAMTVYENIAFALEISGHRKDAIKNRVHELLGLVDLEDKIYSYPSQLSGGQKQRVGIARALANKPDVLLSDEATSALDPQTTYAILDLLKSIHKALNITIVLITHDFDVLRNICKNTAVLENGKVVETGTVDKFFNAPESQTAKNFIQIVKNVSLGFQNVGGEGI